MKRCPSCARIYTDDSLVYCLEDGSALLTGTSNDSGLAATLLNAEPHPTVPSRPETSFPNPRPAQPLRQYAPPATPPAWMGPPAQTATLPSSRGRGLAVTALVLAIASFLLLGFCIIAGATGVNVSLIGGIFIFSALLGLVGAILGIVALVKAGKDPRPLNSKTLAAVALALNGVYLIIVMIFLIVGAVSS